MNAPQQIATDALLDIGSGVDQYLTFILHGEEYGVDILRVQEIRGWDAVTPIPNTPKYIKGVINLRGTIVPIVDLRERFNIEAMDYGPTTVVIVLRINGAERNRIMGIVVDAVSEVYNIGADDIKPAPDFGEVVDLEYVHGIGAVDDKMIIMLNIDRLLSGDELSVQGAEGQGPDKPTSAG